MLVLALLVLSALCAQTQYAPPDIDEPVIPSDADEPTMSPDVDEPMMPPDDEDGDGDYKPYEIPPDAEEDVSPDDSMPPDDSMLPDDDASPPGPEDSKPPSEKPRDESMGGSLTKHHHIAWANNRFALAFLKKHVHKTKKLHKNIFFCPLSISQTLAMLLVGAEGKTRRQLMKLFKFEPDFAEHMPMFRYSLKSNHPELVTFEYGNTLFVQDGVSVLPTYERNVSKAFGARPQTVNFRRGGAARKKINKWVEDQTKGGIKELFPKGSLKGSTRLAIVNAVNFYADWIVPFTATKKMPFTRDDGSKVDVDMMFLDSKHVRISKYSDKKTRARVDVVSLSYKGGEYEFVAMSSKRAKINDILKKLKGRDTKRILDNLTKKSVNGHLYMPKFKIDQSIKMIPTLQSLGLWRIFTQKAELGGMTGDRNMYVSSAQHAAAIEVNEKGTKASAATGVGTALFSTTPEVRLNKPFFFFILHKASDTILFTGRVADPTFV